MRDPRENYKLQLVGGSVLQNTSIVISFLYKSCASKIQQSILYEQTLNSAHILDTNTSPL